MSDHIPDASKMDTPETDELINENLDKLGLIRLAMFCQRLERERDQAIKKRDEAQKALQSLIEAMTFTNYANGYSKYTVVLGEDEIDALRKAAGEKR